MFGLCLEECRHDNQNQINFGKSVLLRNESIKSRSVSYISFPPFNCRVSFVFYLEKGIIPNICMLCFVEINRVLLNLLSLDLVLER